MDFGSEILLKSDEFILSRWRNARETHNHNDNNTDVDNADDSDGGGDNDVVEKKCVYEWKKKNRENKKRKKCRTSGINNARSG